jgi:hypothetical protein
MNNVGAENALFISATEKQILKSLERKYMKQ